MKDDGIEETVQSASSEGPKGKFFDTLVKITNENPTIEHLHHLKILTNSWQALNSMNLSKQLVEEWLRSIGGLISGSNFLGR